MDLSVIISTWNNSKRLLITLESLCRCQIPRGLKWELIIVNNHCTDDTAWVIDAFFKRLPILYLYESTQGLSVAKNKGLRSASGQLVIFTDDDVKVPVDWITLYWKAYLTNKLKTFFGGPIESDYEETPNLELVKLAPYSVKGFDCGNHKHFLEGKNFISANWACEKQVLLELGGFDTAKGLNPASKTLITGEEVDLMQRLRQRGYKALYLPNTRIKHYVPASKCTLKHIASRVEAFSIEKITSSCLNHKEQILQKIPMIATTLAKSGVKLALDKIQGKKDSIAYVNFRRGIGYLRGVKESLIHKGESVC